MEGLESRFREAIERLGKPTTPAELQGLTDFLLQGAVSQLEICDRQVVEFAKLADSLPIAIDFFTEFQPQARFERVRRIRCFHDLDFDTTEVIRLLLRKQAVR